MCLWAPTTTQHSTIRTISVGALTNRQLRIATRAPSNEPGTSTISFLVVRSGEKLWMKQSSMSVCGFNKAPARVWKATLCSSVFVRTQVLKRSKDIEVKMNTTLPASRAALRKAEATVDLKMQTSGAGSVMARSQRKRPNNPGYGRDVGDRR